MGKIMRTWGILQEVVQRYQDSHPGLPMVMGGVSMGGMVATLTVMRDQDMWQARPVHSFGQIQR